MGFGYTDIGSAALLIAFIASVFAVVAFIWGKAKGYAELLEAGRNAVFSVFGLITVASLVMIYALVSRDFGVKYVAGYTDRALSLEYTLSAFWAGQEGSLLFWGWLLSLFTVIVILQNKDKHRELMPYVAAVLMITTAFFLMLLTMVTNPFYRLPTVPADGQGLNPLLQNPGMLFHPPATYLGYVGFAIPFAFAMAALLTGRLGDEWIRSTRRWTLFSWFFLSMGNFLGAQWAYVELGWGGFWAWDPVENASFMPWLTGTAYLHSVMIQQRRGMLKVWNMVLIIITFALTIFGTFLTRSGILSSVHSFADSNLGPFFLAFLGIAVVFAVSFMIGRLADLRSDNELDSLVSRESSFLLNNLILLGSTVATFWGVVFPLVSEAVRGVKVTVSMPFFNQVNGPIFMALLLIMGICPLIGWRKASTDNLIRNFLYPTVIALIFAAIAYGLGMRDLYALSAVSLCVFVVAVILLEVWRGTRARHRTAGENYLVALGRLIWHNKPRYGGYIVHLSIVMIAMGIIGSFAFHTEKEVTLAPGEMMNIDRFSIKYNSLAETPKKGKDVVTATVEVYNAGQRVGYLFPAKEFSPQSEEPSTEVAIRTTLMEDVYVILAGWDKDQTASFKVLVNPLVVWIWIGGAVMLFGTAIALWPDKKEKRRLDARYRAEGVA